MDNKSILQSVRVSLCVCVRTCLNESVSAYVCKVGVFVSAGGLRAQCEAICPLERK